jgi:hypothetical protein
MEGIPPLLIVRRSGVAVQVVPPRACGRCLTPQRSSAAADPSPFRGGGPRRSPPTGVCLPLVGGLVVGLPRCGIVCLRSSVSMSFVLGTGPLARVGGLRALHIDASSLRQGWQLSRKAGVWSGRSRQGQALLRLAVCTASSWRARPSPHTQHLTPPFRASPIRTGRHGAVLLDQSSRDGTVAGDRPSEARTPGTPSHISPHGTSGPSVPGRGNLS